MNRLLSRVFVHPIEGTAPRIVELTEEILVAGMSMETNIKSIYRDVPRLAKQHETFKENSPVPNRKEPWAFVAVSLDYDEATGTFTYLVGDVVTSFDGLPSGLLPFKIPSMTYAVFPIRPRNRFGWGIAIGSAKEYAYGTWMKISEHEQGRVIDDFEYHDERSIRKRDPEIDLYVCIQPRKEPIKEAG
jgi:predicted transcriptional regulator YdeE